MRITLRNLLTLATLLALPAQAADWVLVANDNLRRIELDRATMMPSDGGSKIAWGRIVLSDMQAAKAGYKTIRALNRYECKSRSFSIVKRIYLSADDRTLREEQVDSSVSTAVRPGTVDERFFNIVCEPAAGNSAGSVASREDAATPSKKLAGKASAKQTGEEMPRQVGRLNAPNATPAAPNIITPAQLLEVARRAEAKAAEAKAAETKTTEARHVPGRKKGLDRSAEGLIGKGADVRLVSEQAAEAEKPAKLPASSISPIGKPGTSKTATPNAEPVPSAAASMPIPSIRPVLTLPRPPVAENRVEEPAPALRYAGPSRVANPQPKPKPEAKTETKPDVAAHTKHSAHWSYEGETGPEFWGKMNPEYAACAKGTRQSPIDIRDGIAVDQELIDFDYKPSFFRILDNGHTIQVNYGAGSTITVMGRTYELVQFHFHRPSEERVDGKAFDMVAHLVHKDSEGKFAVVSVLLERGESNPFIQTLWNNLPLEQNQEYGPKTFIQIADLLPQKRGYYAYMGSLTTPPCTEGVLWLVMKTPVKISLEQIGVFSRFYANNSRPVQAMSGRVIKESR